MDPFRQEPTTWRLALPVGALALGFGALGAMSVASGDFAFQWQPVPAEVPARATLAMGAGALELVAAAMLLPARLRAAGAWLAGLLLFGWTLLHVPSVVQKPASIADWLGVAESAAMACGALTLAAAGFGVAAAGKIRRVCAIVFGASALVFGLSHFAYADFTASMIPAWLPQRVALAWFTGAAHALAGLAILTGIRRALAATLEGVMMASFVVLVHLPRVLGHPESRFEWTMLFVAVTLSACAGLVAELSARAR